MLALRYPLSRLFALRGRKCFVRSAAQIVAALICGQTAAAQQSAQKLTPPTVLSLIVSAKDPEQMQQAIERLALVARTRRVTIGNVMIVGNAETGGTFAPDRLDPNRNRTDYTRNLLVFGPKYQLLHDAGVPGVSRVQSDRVLERYDIRSSPAWIVRYRGSDYVFEGWTDPAQLFTQRGEFLRAEQ